jgi:MFS family permease
MYPETNDAILMVFYLLYSLFVMAYCAYAYIGMGLGGFRMARKIGMTNPWLFWIPMANVYAMGNLADQQTALCEGKSTSYRKKLLAWNIITICAASVTLLAVSIGSLPLCIAGLCLTGLSYGACPTITAAFTSSFFGMKHFSTNMALMTFTVMGGSLIATVSNKVLEATGGYNATFLMLLGLTFVALILNVFIRKP